jgi:hypothetical protein
MANGVTHNTANNLLIPYLKYISQKYFFKPNGHINL